MFGLGTQELLIIFVIVVFVFGANRIPEIFRALGGSMKEFKKGMNEDPKDTTTAATKKEEEKKA